MHILILAHSDSPPLEALIPMLQNLGHTHAIIRMPFGEHPPAVAHVDGLIILGAAASVYNPDLNWIQNEIAYVTTCIEEKKPIFGICFGCQMLATILGGSCIAGTNGREFSYTNLTLVADDPLFDTKTIASLPVFQAHGDTYTLPKTATQLLAGDVYPQQAARFAPNIYGTQFHPEVTAEVAGRWHRFNLENGRIFSPQSPTIDEHMKLTKQNQKPVHKWLEGFLGRLFTA